jgi:hypothetical protein
VTPTIKINNATLFVSATRPPPPLRRFGALLRHRPTELGHTIGIDGKVLPMWAEFITHDLIQPKIKDEGKEPAPIRSPIVHSAMSTVEKHTPTVTVFQLQITIPVQSGEARETCRFEPCHISLGQRHLRVDTTEVAVVALAGVIPHFSPAFYCGPRMALICRACRNLCSST